jgi:hypothetical protein
VNVRLPTGLSDSCGCEREEEVLCRCRENLKSHMLLICYVGIIWLIIGCLGMFRDTKSILKSIDKLVLVCTWKVNRKGCICLSLYDIIYVCNNDEVEVNSVTFAYSRVASGFLLPQFQCDIQGIIALLSFIFKFFLHVHVASKFYLIAFIIQWISVIGTCQDFVPFRRLPQLYEVTCKELKRCMYMRQKISFPLI